MLFASEDLPVARLRLLGMFALVSLVLVLSGTTSAQGQVPFPWGTFVGQDGKTHKYPQWDQVKLDQTAMLAKAKGELTFSTGTTVTEATLKVYTVNPATGMWSQTPALELTATPTGTLNKITGPIDVPNSMNMVKKWAIEWGEDLVNAPPSTIPYNANVKVVVTVKTTSGGTQTTKDYAADLVTATER